MDSGDVLRILLDVGRSGKVELNHDQEQALAHFESCRTAALGCRIYLCPDCRVSMVVYNSCNKRGCPKCAQKSQMAWMAKASKRLLPVGHHHLVFSVPQSFTEQWMRDPRGVISLLFKGVNAVFKEIEESQGLLLGRMLVFQSHGQGMSYKPHIHCLLADGGLDARLQWRPLAALDLEKMTQSVRTWFEKHDPATDKTNGWSIYDSYHEKNAEAVIRYLGHRMAGVVIRIDGNSEINKNTEAISLEDRHEGQSRTTKLNEETFARRYLKHIPPKHSVTVRYYGLYANRHRVERQMVRDYLDLFHQDKGIEKVEYQELCPCCRRPMKEALSVECGLEVDYACYGFANGPPLHREYQRAS